MIELHVEWEEAPGVHDPCLARTWARLEIRIEGHPGIQLLDARASSVRHGVHGSVLPLAAWLVENWWHVLYEHAPAVAIFEGGRAALALGTMHRDWIRRHNLLAAREGMALPDMMLFRDQDRICVRWMPDPEPGERSRGPARRRFISKGIARLDPLAVETTLADFVEVVLERLREQDSKEVTELREHWNAISDSRDGERKLCETLAAIGADPYDIGDEEEMRLVEIEDQLDDLEPKLREDLLNAATRNSIEHDCRYLGSGSDVLPRSYPAGPLRREIDRTVSQSQWPHVDGYERARALREVLAISPVAGIPDLDKRIDEIFDGHEKKPILFVEPQNSSVEGLLGFGADGHPVLVAPGSRPEPGERFLAARALHQWLYTADEPTRRLLTRGHSWDQRASRAFAAELLAPSTAIQERLTQDPDIDYDALASEFKVSSRVISHQIENHRLL